MNRLRTLIAVPALLLGSSAIAIDTSEPFLCAVAEVNECLDGFGCETILPEIVNAPTFIWVDVDKKRIRTNQNEAGSKIENRAAINGRLVLQGADQAIAENTGGAGWTLSIEDSTGRFVASIAIQQASISLFGSCTELP